MLAGDNSPRSWLGVESPLGRAPGLEMAGPDVVAREVRTDEQKRRARANGR